MGSQIHVKNASDFLNPRSIAIVGASDNPRKFGYEITKNIIETASRHIAVYPISLKAEQILGLKAYKNATELPEVVDLCIVAVPSPLVLGVVEQFHKSGTRKFIVISGGFKEAGSEGVERENQLAEFVSNHDIELIGPNCVGVVNGVKGFNLSFIQTPLSGPIGIVSQSGSVGAHISYVLREIGLGLSHFLNLGNALDIDVADAIMTLADDDATKVVGIYLEGVQDGTRLVKALDYASKRKPVVMLKGGMTTLGAASAASHTGSLASSKVAITAACRQTGVFLARSDMEFINALKALGYLEVPKAFKVVQLTNAGGPSVMTADLLDELNIEYPALSEEKQKGLLEFLPPFVSTTNPLDMLASARMAEYEKASDILLSDHPDALLVAICVVPTFLEMTPTEHLEGVLKAIKKHGTNSVVLGWLSGVVLEESRKLASKEGLPLFENVQSIAQAAAALLHRRKVLDRMNSTE